VALAGQEGCCGRIFLEIDVQLVGAGGTPTMKFTLKGNSQFVKVADDREDGCSHMDFRGSMEKD
jgi:hypothetical protein